MKKIVMLSIITLLFIALLIFYKFPKEIHVTRSAIQYVQGKPNSARTTSVRIDGHMSRPLFGKDSFTGTVVIDSLPFTKQDTMLDMIVSEKKNDIDQANLTYQSNQSPYMISNQGLIWFDRDFENINIWGAAKWLHEGESSEQLYIVAPASNVNEAVQVQSQMRSSFGEDFVPKSQVQ